MWNCCKSGEVGGHGLSTRERPWHSEHRTHAVLKSPMNQVSRVNELFGAPGCSSVKWGHRDADP